MPVAEVRQRLIEVFERWGKPGAMRVDNGLPLGVPTGDATPALALWLIGMDIDMIWNKPYCPQMNARVEKMQDTTARWAEVHTAGNALQLQHQLNVAIRMQRERYPVVRLKAQTRLGAYPVLQSSPRPYMSSDFMVQRVYAFLATKLYTRKVSASGQVKQFGVFYTVGYPLRKQWVQLRLTPDGQAWEVLADYKVVKVLAALNLSREHVQNLTVFQKTKSTTS